MIEETHENRGQSTGTLYSNCKSTSKPVIIALALRLSSCECVHCGKTEEIKVTTYDKCPP